MQKTKIQLLGHATLKVTTPENKVILVDPWLTDNPFIPEGLEQQDRVDMMLITHGHDDHFDINLPDYIQKYQATVVANPVCRWYLLENGVSEHQIEPMNIGGTITVMDMKISMVNAFHVSHINEPNGKFTHPHQAVGFVLQLSDGIKIYFAGDTSAFGDMKIIGDIYQPDLAVLPIGDRYTMGPVEAAYAIRLLGVRHVLPIHYGTYAALTGRPEILVDLTKNIAGLQIHILPAGGIIDGSELL